MQQIQYDSKNGWIGPSGCRLKFGRPLVCYQFFCNEVIESALYKSVGIQAIINDFVSIGKSAHGDVHLICIDNLEILSPQKIEKICYKIKMLMKEV
jgi:hypothetical protein